MRFGFPRWLILALILAAGTLAGSRASAQSFTDALVSAYSSSPQFQADHARQRALDEDVARAAGGWKPQAQISGQAGKGRDAFYQQSITASPPFQPAVPGHRHEMITPNTYSLQIVQPIYDGGRAAADVDRSKSAVTGGKAHAGSVEQAVLGDAIQSYYDLFRDQALVELQRTNVTWLKEEMDATNELFRKQQVTRTDVAQAEARLARAVAGRVAAEGAVAASGSAFARATGLAPSPKLQAPPALPKPLLPSSGTEVMALATQSPTVKEAEQAVKTAAADVDFVSSALKPNLSLQVTSNYANETVQKNFAQRYHEVLGSLTIPLYTGGTDYARVREAKNILTQRKFEADEARRQAVDRAKRAWEQLASNQAQIEFLKQQVKSTEIARKSIITERSVGTRTTIDQLNAEQDWLEAEIALVQAQHDEAISTFTVLGAVGRLTARALHLPVQLYDPDENYRRESGRWFGTDIPEYEAPVPQAP